MYVNTCFEKKAGWAYCKGESISCLHIVGCVGCLDYHALALNWPAREVELVASATPKVLDMAFDINTGESVRKGVVHSPRLLVRAGIGGPTGSTTSSGRKIPEGVVLFIAGEYRAGDLRLLLPRT